MDVWQDSTTIQALGFGIPKSTVEISMDESARRMPGLGSMGVCKENKILKKNSQAQQIMFHKSDHFDATEHSDSTLVQDLTGQASSQKTGTLWKVAVNDTAFDTEGKKLVPHVASIDLHGQASNCWLTKAKFVV